jgi:hypothetical protein
LILPWVRVQHLASHILGRMAGSLSNDWDQLYGHPVYFAETFTDPGRFRGTCYRAANPCRLPLDKSLSAPHFHLPRLEGVANRKQPPRYPGCGEEFFLDFLPAEPRRIQRDGIHFHRIRYWDSVLSPWAGRLKKDLLIKYDPRNLARVFVRDPNGKHWPVPYADLRQPPIALWELQEARRRLRESGARDPNERAIFASILQQRRLVKEATSQSKQRRRKERTPPVEIQPVTERARSEKASADLQPFPVEIWERE